MVTNNNYQCWFQIKDTLFDLKQLIRAWLICVLYLLPVQTNIIGQLEMYFTTKNLGKKFQKDERILLSKGVAGESLNYWNVILVSNNKS